MSHADHDNLDLCPDESVLQECARGEASSPRIVETVSSHLAYCPTCKHKFDQLRRDNTQAGENPNSPIDRLLKRQEETRRAKETGPVPGTIWRATPESAKVGYGPLLLVLRTNDDGRERTAWVAEMSEQIPQAIETDYILEQGESGLGFRCMVRAGNVFGTDVDNLVMFAGKLPPSIIEKVGEFVSSSAAFDANVPLSHYQFYRDSTGTQLMRRNRVTSGMLVTNDKDLRQALLQSSVERLSYLHFPDPSTSGSTSAQTKRIPRSEHLGNLVTLCISWLQQLRSRSLWRVMAPVAATLVVIVTTAKITEVVVRKNLESQSKPVLRALPSRGLVDTTHTSTTRINHRQVNIIEGALVQVGPRGWARLEEQAKKSAGTSDVKILTSPDRRFRSLRFALINTGRVAESFPKVAVGSLDCLLIPYQGDFQRDTYLVSEEKLISLSRC